MEQLPTIVTSSFEITSLRDSLIRALAEAGPETQKLKIYMYAVTAKGWNELRPHIKKWLRHKSHSVELYVGTDDGITDIKALRQIQNSRISVYLVMNEYGVFHPKVFWLIGANRNLLWAGSNNLSGQGLTENVEFALLATFSKPPKSLFEWSAVVEAQSAKATDALLKSYQDEVAEYRKKKSELGSFVWSQRARKRKGGTERRRHTQKKNSVRKTSPLPRAKRPLGHERRGDLVLEIMPRETSEGGRQIQIPIDVAADFFRVPRKKSGKRKIIVTDLINQKSRQTTMTIYGNDTVRITISGLEYSDRPCVVLFRRKEAREFQYEVIRKAIDPKRYQALLDSCPTNMMGARRWKIL